MRTVATRVKTQNTISSVVEKNGVIIILVTDLTRLSSTISKLPTADM